MFLIGDSVLFRGVPEKAVLLWVVDQYQFMNLVDHAKQKLDKGGRPR